MSGMYGADPDQLQALGTTLKRQMEAVSSVLSQVSGVLGTTLWQGPAHDATFQFSGLEDVRRKIAEACKWPEGGVRRR